MAFLFLTCLAGFISGSAADAIMRQEKDTKTLRVHKSHGEAQLSAAGEIEMFDQKKDASESSLQEMFSSLWLQHDEKDLIPIQDTCSKFKLDRMGCLRLEAYVAKTLLDLKARLHLKINVHDKAFSILAGDVTSKEGLVHASIKPSPGYNGIIRKYAETFEFLPQEVATKPFILAGDDMAYLMPWWYPTLVRVAPFPDLRGNHVIVRIDRAHHEDAITRLASTDVPFHEKLDVLVWRGSTTGQVHPSPCQSKWLNRSRMLLVQKYGVTDDVRIDVGFAGNLVSGVPPNWKRDRKDMTNLLKNKFIMVVDGNGEATSTEWVMASNSVPFMAPPSLQTWCLHSWLQPWKHYVPLEPDFSDVSSKLDWAISNPTAAAQIAREGAAFMKEFEDKDREERINAAVLATYLDRVEIESTPVETSLHGELMPTQCSGQRGGSYVVRNLFNSLR